MRGDATMIHYLMSRDGCQLRNPSASEDEEKCRSLARHATMISSVKPECFKLFLELASVDLNQINRAASRPLLPICLFSFGAVTARTRARTSRHVSMLERRAQKIGILLELGADPFRESYDSILGRPSTPFQLAKYTLKAFKENGRYPLSWPLWEQLIEKMEAMHVSG